MYLMHLYLNYGIKVCFTSFLHPIFKINSPKGTGKTFQICSYSGNLIISNISHASMKVVGVSHIHRSPSRPRPFPKADSRPH